MKTQYICEKCGQTFENYEDAYKCENNHHMLDFSSMEQELRDYVEFGVNKEIPSKMIVPSEEISEWHEADQEFESRRVFGEYKLVRILPDKEVTPIMAAYTERREREKREWEEYMARRRAEKAAKEAEQKEAE